MGTGLEERKSTEEESKKGREEEVGRGLLVGRGLVGDRRSSCERGGPAVERAAGRAELPPVWAAGRGLETSWMGWMSRMVPGVDWMDTGDAVTVLNIFSIDSQLFKRMFSRSNKKQFLKDK